MENSNFSTLIYRIIGKPDRWHEDYIDMMHQVLDETDSFDDPKNFSELAVGEQILSRISDPNDALIAFGSLLDRSRFKMIILDDHFAPIYHNSNAKALFKHVQNVSDKTALKPLILSKAQEAASLNAQKHMSDTPSNLSAMDYRDENNDQIYLRTIQNQNSSETFASTFYLLLALDPNRHQYLLNRDLVDLYKITDKEEMVLLKLIHGRTIKEISAECFVSENTVKTHLKALFRKTNSKSQADIIRLVLTHESQILDSYFGTSRGPTTRPKNDNKDKQFVLNNHLSISYRDYGPKDGYPIIVFHNGFGCRLSIPIGFEQACERTNRRIIIPDRPGFGGTPFIEGHPKHWAHYLDEFIDSLNIEKYDILGNVLGSCMALIFASEADARLQRVRLASPVFVNRKQDCKHLTGIFGPSIRLVQESKRFAREIYELWLKSIKINVSTHYRSMVERSVGSAERELFESNGTIDLLVNTFREGIRNSFEGISHEMVFCISPRELELDKINCPVDLWWGTEDGRISLQGVEVLADQLKDVSLFVREGYSEHIYFSLFEEIIS